MKKFCDSLRKHTKNIIDFEKKIMLPLTRKESKSHEDAKECYICGKGMRTNAKDIHHWKVIDHCHYTRKYRDAADSIYNLKFKIPNEIPVVIHNGSNYDCMLLLCHVQVLEWILII